MILMLPSQSLVLNAYAVLVGQTPGHTALTEHGDYIAANGEAAYKTALNNIFASYTTAELATSMLTNLGLSSVFSQAEAVTFLTGATNRVSAMMDLANALYHYNGSDAAIVAAKTTYVAAVEGSYNYSTDTTHVSGTTLTGSVASGGQTLTLTTAADSGAAFTGTANGDNYVGTIATGGTTTLNAGDVLNAGSGTDTLTLSIAGTGGSTTAGIVLTSIENIVLSNYSSGAGDSINLAQATGVAKISVIGSSAAGDTSFTNVAGIVTAEMGGGAGDLSITYADAAVTGSADAQTLNLTGQTAGSFNVTGTTNTKGVETLNISSRSSANTLSINDAVTATIATINVTGDQDLTLTEGGTDADDAVATINAGTFTGKLVVTTGSIAHNMSITGGTANDTITLGLFDVNDSVDGGSGTDTLSVAVAVTDVNLAHVTNVEKLTVTGGASVTLAANVTATTFTVSDATASVVTLNTGYTNATTVALGVTDSVVNNANVALTINATATNMMSGADISITGGTGTDTLNITADASVDPITLATITGVEAINIVDGGDSSTTAGKDAYITIGAGYATNLTVDASALDAGTLTGTTMNADYENLNFNGLLQSTAATVLNVTGGAGADTIQGGAGNDIIAGGAGNDSINGSAGGADSITAGDGDDTINMAGALTSADTIDGGSGTDILAVTSLSASGLTNVTNVETLSLSGAASAATLTANLSFTSIDMSTVDNTAQVLTLSTGYTNATTVSVDSGDKVVNSANVAMTVTADAADLVAASATTITGGTGTDTLSVLADSTTANIVATSGLITNVDTITVRDGGDVTSGTVTAGKDITIDLAAYATATTALTIDASALDAGTVVSNVMTNDEVLTITGVSARALNVTGGGGADVIVGSNSTSGDSLKGGLGNDTFTMDANLSYKDTIVGGGGTDRVSVTTGAAVNDVDFMHVSDADTLTLGTGGTKVTLGSYFDASGIATINLDSTTAAGSQVDAAGTTNGHTFNAIAAGGAVVNQTVAGGMGNDTFNFGNGALLADDLDGSDSIDGGAGTDTIVISNALTSASATIDFNATHVTNVENVTMGTASGLAATSAETVTVILSDITSTTAQTINLDGSVITDSHDTITVTSNVTTATGGTKFSITGGAGADTLAGGVNADTISGGSGADVISGNGGADSLTGGAGNDIFGYALASSQSTNAATDTISDFTTGEDNVVISYTTVGTGTSVLDFTNKGTATSSADGLALLSGTATSEATGRIGQYFYNSGTKQIVLDTDGNGLVQATDFFVTLAGSTALASGDVNFAITANAANQTITTGGGNDTVDMTAAGNMIVTTGAGNDTIYAAQGTYAAGSDSVLGGTGTDTLSISGAGAVNLTTDASLTGIENITLTTNSVNLATTNQTEAFNITFAGGTNTLALSATAGLAHTITGGGGVDTVTVTNHANLNSIRYFRWWSRYGRYCCKYC
ncbi:MAG: hypothetical protein NT087_06600 [Deltaproteobacteria bacterium]|nr:hypothetical protein [Deltaproteobacteria bacterium]